MSTDVADSNDQQQLATLQRPRVSRFLRPFQLIQQQRYVPVCAATWTLLLFQIVAIIEKMRDDVFHVYSPVMLVWVIFCSLLPALLFPAGLSLFFRNWPFLQRLSKAVLLFTVFFIALVVNRMHFPLSFSLLAENANELLYTESLDLIYGHLLPGHIVLFLLIIGILVYQVVWGRALLAKTEAIYPWRSLSVIALLSFTSVFCRAIALMTPYFLRILLLIITMIPSTNLYWKKTATHIYKSRAWPRDRPTPRIFSLLPSSHLMLVIFPSAHPMATRVCHFYNNFAKTASVLINFMVIPYKLVAAI